MPCIYEVDDANVSFGGVIAMQATSVLLQRSLPRDGHRQNQRV
jgi:hypothetical protein